MIQFCQDNDIAFVLVGPEAPLVAGMVDDLTKAGIKAWGPTAYCAQRRVKSLCQRFYDKTPYPTANTKRAMQNKWLFMLKAEGALIVIKADGLAAGKGVIVAMSRPRVFDAP